MAATFTPGTSRMFLFFQNNGQTTHHATRGLGKTSEIGG